MNERVMWVYVEVPWGQSAEGRRSIVVHRYYHPWALASTIGVAVQREAERQGRNLKGAEVDTILRSLRITSTLEFT